ncbi:MAG: hypothetical protein FJ403_14450 [Verrucomicrobia bacterium]|nr:hypothetical protein [Verrucomicrobiota bacterium]
MGADIAKIHGISESTAKKHVLEIFGKLGVETRSAATPRALEVLGTAGNQTRTPRERLVLLDRACNCHRTD